MIDGCEGWGGDIKTAISKAVQRAIDECGSDSIRKLSWFPSSGSFIEQVVGG